VLTPWYADLANYLSIGKVPPSFSPKEKRRLIKKSTRYSWVNVNFVYTGYDMMIRRYIREHEIIDILTSCHDQPCGGHFVTKRTTHKIISLGYYWT